MYQTVRRSPQERWRSQTSGGSCPLPSPRDQSLHPMWNHELQALPPTNQVHFVPKQSVQRVSICVSLQGTDMKLLCVSHRCQRAPCRATWMFQTSSQSQNQIYQFKYLNAWHYGLWQPLNTATEQQLTKWKSAVPNHADWGYSQW